MAELGSEPRNVFLTPPLLLAAMLPGQRHHGVGISIFLSPGPSGNALYPLSRSVASYFPSCKEQRGDEKVGEGWGLEADGRRCPLDPAGTPGLST